ncbi:MAG: magnesium transporter [Candidatus Omnitrophota bacterium]|nr:MAG: magnesium transporter [Candidatus Omnitrophota bacterium]
MKKAELGRLRQSVLTIIRRDVAILHQELTVSASFDEIRSQGIGEKIIYFYVVDDNNQLVGVVPTRRLLTASLHQPLAEIMIRQVVTISRDAIILEAHELLARHKFLALPVVDQQRRIVGVVDVSMFTDMEFEIAERERMDEVFESIGFLVSQVRDASPLRAFRYRFPWLLATIASGTICALLVSAFEATLAQCILLAFFLTLVLGLGESVSIQSMTVTIQALRATRPTWRWYTEAFRRELGAASFLGAACGVLISLIVWFWRGTGLAAIAIGSSILLSLCAACLFGLSIPTILHALKLDPKIAAGPVTLALADIFTILFYFGIASVLL